MMRFSVLRLLILTASVGLLTEGAIARPSRNPTLVFDSAGFWEHHASHPEMAEAWRHGVRWEREPGAVGVYYGRKIYAFTARAIPKEQNASVSAKIGLAYAERAEIQAINTLGLFAFNQFECSALAEFTAIPPNAELCDNITLSEKITSHWEENAFSIAAAPVESICGCRKAMDKGNREYSGSFYGTIARAELARLAREGKPKEAVDFFVKNSAKRIFLAPELILVSGCYVDLGQPQDAIIILDALTEHWRGALSSEQLERCGDLYYSAGEKQAAIRAYSLATAALHQ